MASAGCSARAVLLCANANAWSRMRVLTFQTPGSALPCCHPLPCPGAAPAQKENQSPLNDLERLRQQRCERNRSVLASLGLDALPSEMGLAKRPHTGARASPKRKRAEPPPPTRRSKRQQGEAADLPANLRHLQWWGGSSCCCCSRSACGLPPPGKPGPGCPPLPPFAASSTWLWPDAAAFCWSPVQDDFHPCSLRPVGGMQPRPHCSHPTHQRPLLPAPPRRSMPRPPSAGGPGAEQEEEEEEEHHTQQRRPSQARPTAGGSYDAHNAMRIRSMSHQALQKRIHKIRNVGKLESFVGLLQVGAGAGWLGGAGGPGGAASGQGRCCHPAATGPAAPCCLPTEARLCVDHAAGPHCCLTQDWGMTELAAEAREALEKLQPSTVFEVTMALLERPADWVYVS